MKDKQRQKAYNRGLKAEKLCKLWLRLKGYRILAQRFSTPVGEIDVIACRSNTIVAIEVKTRNSYVKALESVSTKQCRHIEQTLEWFLVRHEMFINHQRRFDIMLVVSWRIQHIKDAWRPIY